MYGTTLFHVHNSKIFAAGHFLIAANSSGVQARVASNTYFGCSPWFRTRPCLRAYRLNMCHIRNSSCTQSPRKSYILLSSFPTCNGIKSFPCLS